MPRIENLEQMQSGIKIEDMQKSIKKNDGINKFNEALGNLNEANKQVKTSIEELNKINERNEEILSSEVQHWAGIDCSVKVSRETRRNDPCPCGSGKKAKNCCGAGKKHIPFNFHKPHVFK
jgi:preprotein translocase subunit SecA